VLKRGVTWTPASLSIWMPSGKLMRVGFQTRGSKEYCCPMIFSMSPATHHSHHPQSGRMEADILVHLGAGK